MATQNDKVSDEMTQRERALKARAERLAKPREKTFKEKAAELWSKIINKGDKPKSFEQELAEKQNFVHAYLQKLGKGDFYVPVENDHKYEDEYVSESMAIFSIEKEAEFGKFIENKLPPEDKTKGFHYVNPNNRPFHSQLTADIKPGNIVGMFYEAFAMHYGLLLSPATMHQCMSFTISKFMDVCSNQMRKFVVNHEGKKKVESLISPIEAAVLEKVPKLEITSLNYKEPVYREVMAIYNNITTQLRKEILADVKDPTLLENVFADYPSMTPIDKLSNCVQVLSTVKHYYAMVCSITCGFPFVVMKGELTEWAELNAKIQRLRYFFFKCMIETFPYGVLEMEEYKTMHPKQLSNLRGDFGTFATNNQALIEKFKADTSNVALGELPKTCFYGVREIETALYERANALHKQVEKIYEKKMENTKDEETEKNRTEIEKLKAEYDELRAKGEREKGYVLQDKINDLYNEISRKRHAAEEEIRKEMPEYTQLLDCQKKSDEFINVQRMYNYLTNFGYIMQNMYEARQGQDKTSFWNRAFSLQRRIGCGGPPYYENGWIFNLIVSTEGDEDGRSRVRFVSGSETRYESMKSNIQIEYVKGKMMNLTTGILGYHQVDLAQEFGGSGKEKMIALEPVIHFKQEISLPN